MKICAVVCEYNPFHNGHRYHLEKARRYSGADAVLCLMSGEFVQRAEPAVLDPYFRARTALENGADAVIQLPVVYSVASGQKFAEGAVRILSRFPEVKALAFGCESSEEKLMRRIADVQSEETPAFRALLREKLDGGLSYAAAYTFATRSAVQNATQQGSMCDVILKDGNNLLAIEYLKALKRFAPKVEPVFIRRIGNGHDSPLTGGETLSATAIRALLKAGDYTAIMPYVPEDGLTPLREVYAENRVDERLYGALVVHSLRNEPLGTLADAVEGIDVKLRENALKYLNMEEILQATKSKRYPMSRLKRLCLQALLNIRKEAEPFFESAKPRLLGVREDFRPFLSVFAGRTYLQNSDYERLSEAENATVAIEKRASNVYSLVTGRAGNAFFGRKLLTV